MKKKIIEYLLLGACFYIGNTVASSIDSALYFRYKDKFRKDEEKPKRKIGF